jgi:mercuric reductase
VRHELSLVEKLRAEKYERVMSMLSQVTSIDGSARFVSPTEIVVNGDRLSADKFVSN